MYVTVDSYIIHFIAINSFFENLIVPLLAKKLLEFGGARRFIAAATSDSQFPRPEPVHTYLN
jgi:hypothetical protein